MRLLFVVGDLSKSNNANLNIVKSLSTELVKLGYEIFILGTCKTDVVIFDKNDKNISYKIINEPDVTLETVNQLLPKYIRSFYLWTKIRIPKLFSLINRIIFTKLSMSNYIANIEELSRFNSIDIVISVSFPILTSMSLAKSKIASKKIVYQLDPYFSHHNNKKLMIKSRALLREMLIYNAVNSVILTNLIYEDNMKSLLRYYHPKMYQLRFPNIRDIGYESNIEERNFYEKGKVNCTFVGNLYNDIRNPSFLLKVFKETSDDIVFHYFGGGDVGLLHQFKTRFSEKIHIHDPIDYEMAIKVMRESDILVNIGNNIENQLPSKLLDYISMGKPIINFVKIKNCPSLEYTSKYPMVINITESDEVTDNLIKDFEKFCKSHKGKRIDYSLIESLYGDWTMEKVCKSFIEILNA